MFENGYSFKGQHAKYIKKLTEVYNEDYKLKIFNTNIEVYLLAPIVGFLFKKNVEVDSTDNLNTKIFNETFSSYREDIYYNYRIILLLDEHYESNKEKRIDKAFRYMDTERGKRDYDHYDGYVRGGVEVLYDNIIKNAHNEEEYLDNLIKFLNEFQEKYKKIFSEDKIENDILKIIREESRGYIL